MASSKAEDWKAFLAALAGLLDYGDTPALWGRIAPALNGLLGLSSISLIDYGPARAPSILFTTPRGGIYDERIAAYVQGGYLFDPFYLACTEQQADGLVYLKAVAPPDFRTSEYFRSFFAAPQIADEVNLILRPDPRTILALSLSRPLALGAFPSAVRSRIDACSAFLARLCIASWQHFQPGASRAASNSQFHQQLKSAIDNFGKSVLTPREKQVLDHLLRGYSVKSAAANLGVTPGTVRIHRHSIYQKLDIGSQTELFALILECLRLSSGSRDEDPLRYMMPPG